MASDTPMTSYTQITDDVIIWSLTSDKEKSFVLNLGSDSVVDLKIYKIVCKLGRFFYKNCYYNGDEKAVNIIK